jgi:hypothetical protein
MQMPAGWMLVGGMLAYWLLIGDEVKVDAESQTS